MNNQPVSGFVELRSGSLEVCFEIVSSICYSAICKDAKRYRAVARFTNYLNRKTFQCKWNRSKEFVLPFKEVQHLSKTDRVHVSSEDDCLTNYLVLLSRMLLTNYNRGVSVEDRLFLVKPADRNEYFLGSKCEPSSSVLNVISFHSKQV